MMSLVVGFFKNAWSNSHSRRPKGPDTLILIRQTALEPAQWSYLKHHDSFCVQNRGKSVQKERICVQLKLIYVQKLRNHVQFWNFSVQKAF